MILPIPLGRRLAAEAVGTGVLALALIGSGIQAAALSQDVGVQLLANTLASVCTLGVLIALLAPVSGAHLNPLVTAGVWWTGRGAPGALPGRQAAGYAAAQLLGGIAGSVLAGLMFDTGTIGAARTGRSGPGVWTGELVATAVLLLVVFGLGRAGRARYAPVAVAAWIAAGIWGTPSGSFANPALTLARAVNDSFTGIAPASVPGYLLGQLAGAALGLLLVRALFGPAGTEVTQA
ncbi:aquaporin [Kitasatospora viridis]|uniref:Glycerol uptake facilitator-like aquaporin n=1 Tax=Kitasatospora viridis TaxID=281105 RepID=A0A561UHX0_9ACTN|nr:aquaporin [Kitasatospora viridis]TWF98968.1 glycerol uptake facilitator-like aquaporin [Kitasatospora viridis]